MAEDRWELAGLSLHSRLLLGTARYPSRQVLLDALDASGTELVTVAVRRVGLGAGGRTSTRRSARRASTSCPTRPGASRRGTP